MKNDYKEGLEQLAQACQKKIEQEVEQFNSEVASEDIKKEEERRVNQNGGKPLDYVLMPRRISRKPSLLLGHGEEEKFYRVPLIFDRLSKKQDPKEKVRHLS